MRYASSILKACRFRMKNQPHIRKFRSFVICPNGLRAKFGSVPNVTVQ